MSGSQENPDQIRGLFNGFPFSKTDHLLNKEEQG